MTALSAGAVSGAVVRAAEFEAPSLDYAALSPLLLVLGVAILGVMVEAFVPRPSRYAAQVGLGMLGLVGALGLTAFVALDATATEGGGGVGTVTGSGALAVDGPALVMWALLLVLGIISLMMFAERTLDGGVTAFAGQAAALPGSEAEREASVKQLEHTEVFPLLMFAIGGMMIFPSANNLLLLFVALEVFSLPLYLLCGLARRRRLLSQESAMKYFLLGAFSSGFFVYGIALVYGYAGSMDYAGIAAAIEGTTGNRGLLLAGMALMATGLFFKVSAVPFHTWTPDVYQGAPTAVTAFMAAATKVAAFGAMLRLFYVAFGPARWDWLPMFWAVAILTMVVGVVLALTQADVKRLLAYSSVAHAGFILTGLLGVQQLSEVGGTRITSIQAVLFYLVTYGFMTLGAFAVVTLVRDSGGEANHLSRWAGLGKEAPVLAAVFAFFLLAMAGIPLTSGFTGKWAVFASALSGGAWPVVVVAVVMSAVAGYFYIRLIVTMYFDEPVGAGPTVSAPSALTLTAITVGFAVTLVLGVVPGPMLDLIGNAGEFIR